MRWRQRQLRRRRQPARGSEAEAAETAAEAAAEAAVTAAEAAVEAAVFVLLRLRWLRRLRRGGCDGGGVPHLR